MVEYSQEFINKCKRIYPDEERLHRQLEAKACCLYDWLGELYIAYKRAFADRAKNEGMSDSELMTAIHNLSIASKLKAESKTFE